MLLRADEVTRSLDNQGTTFRDGVACGIDSFHGPLDMIAVRAPCSNRNTGTILSYRTGGRLVNSDAIYNPIAIRPGNSYSGTIVNGSSSERSVGGKRRASAR